MISTLEAIKSINSGEIVVYPTDTVWGIGCDPMNQKAVDNLFKIKEKKKDGLSIMLGDLKDVEKYCEVNRKIKAVCKGFLPGPLTLILKSKIKFARGVEREGTIGIRVPANSTALELASKGPVITTSANIHQGKIVKTLDEAKRLFGSKCKYLDGEKPEGIESTIIDFTNRQPEIRRIGALYSSILEGLIEF